jgi:hypothetical protein
MDSVATVRAITSEKIAGKERQDFQGIKFPGTTGN